MLSTTRHVLLSVIYPAVDVRGSAADRLRTWTHGQTLARKHYRVIVGCDGATQHEQEKLTALLSPQDELFCLSEPKDVDLWNAGAARARTPWLVFTEGHCLAKPDCLQSVVQWIRSNPAAVVGNFAIDHDDTCALADLNRRWFGMMQVQWTTPGQWARVHRSGFVIRADVFRELGGFEADYSQFAPQLFSARLHSKAIKVDLVPGASIMHEDDERMHEHHEATADFVEGLIKARRQYGPAFFERYFGTPNHWPERSELTRQLATATAATAVFDPWAAAKLFRRWRSSAGALIGCLPKLLLHNIALTLEDAAVDWLPLPARWRWACFLRAHQRAVWREHLRRPTYHCTLPTALQSYPVDELPQDAIVGAYQLEQHGAQCFRWTEPVFMLRAEVPESGSELHIRTLGVCGDPLATLIAVIIGGRVLPRGYVSATPDRALIVRLPGRLAKAAKRGIIFVLSPLAVSGAASTERLVGLPILSIANHKNEQKFVLHGCSNDGWASQSTAIVGFEPSQVDLHLEIPGWLPFKFPVVLKALQQGREIERIAVAEPGIYKLELPISRPGLIELSANQWFVPAELGLSEDKRRICYRFL